VVEELLLRDDAVAVLDEVAQHVEHLGFHVARLARAPELEPSRVDLELVELEYHAPMMAPVFRTSPDALQVVSKTGPPGSRIVGGVNRTPPQKEKVMTSTTTERQPLNGVDVPNLFGTIGAVRDQPELAQFRFRATNRWVAGTHSRTTIEQFSGAGGDHVHKEAFAYDADHPEVLVGADHAPTPVEFLLHALGACLMAGVANIAAARGVTLSKVEASLEGDIDLRGILGISGDVRNGYEQLRVAIRIDGDAPAETLREIVEQSRARSAVYDVLTNGVGVRVDVIP
jgi:uncharacterized OsmC-like protein